MVTLHVRNFYALREVHWSPTGICAVVGANGTGKTTLLLVLKLIRAAVNRGLPQAVASVLGGGHGLRHWGASEDEPVEIGLDVGDLSWRIRLVARGATVDHLADEELRRGSEVIFSKDGLGNFSYRGERWEADERVGLRAIGDGPKPDPDVETVLACIRGLHVFHDPDLWGLRQQGSRTTQDRHLANRGSNAFTILRGWYLSRTHRPRFQFVLDGLRAAFPGLCEDLDFEEAGQTVTARIFAPGREQPSPIRGEANGLLSMLVLLCDVASADEGGVVAIDEPENGLHPYAIRELMRRASAWTHLHGLTIVLTTHSPVLLDELSVEPTQVFVMRVDGRGPVPLDEHRDRAWLAHFRLGELYADGELGSNDDSP
jgi:predicted ATPase